MKRNKNKIIRSVTVSQSLDFCREVMIKMRAMGYDMGKSPLARMAVPI